MGHGKIVKLVCPFDGKPCLRGGACDVSWFGGEKIEDIERCPRLRVGRVLGKEHERERMRRG